MHSITNKALKFFQSGIDRKWITIYLVVLLIGMILIKSTINPLWIGFINLFIFLFPVYYLIFRMIRELLSPEHTQKIFGKKVIISIVMIYTLIGLFIVSFNSQERFVYFWDFSGYWATTISYTDMWFSSPIDAITKIYASILKDEYNVVPQVPLVLLFKLLGTSFPMFTLSIYIAYVIPFFSLISAMILRIISDYNKEISSKIVILIISSIALVTSIMQPVLSGYLDSAGLIACIFITGLVYLREKNQVRTISFYFTMIFFLIGLAFIRRWYAYWILGFFIAYGLIILYRLIFSKGEERKKVIVSLRDLFLIGLGCLIILLVGFREFFTRSLYTNYQDLYSAYQSGGLSHNIELLIQNFGWLTLLISIIGILEGWIRNKNLRPLVFGLVIQMLISFYLFVRVQSMGQQHYYILVPSLTVLFALGVFSLTKLSGQNWYKIIVACLILMLLIGNFSHSFIRQPLPLLKNFNGIYTSNQTYPRVRTDLEQLRLISSYLNELSRNEKPIYVISSSFIFNDDILRKLSMPDNLNPVPSLIGVSHVDKRDGLPKGFLQAEIIVVADPIQYHLNPDDQRVIGELAKPFLQNIGIGKSFLLKKTFTIAEGIKVNVYEKKEALKEIDVLALEQKFQEWYPDLKEKFKFKIE
ncbi:hypothetical protein MHB54_16085 [Paenibacillus sp. FSL M7-0802]|uniref:hypothetical protein n=1 Tax=Paenibacillus TaxID=44249 RepID=UPI0022215544|nr:hypothetical protein [Paenibacillus polymyxa]